MPVHMSPVPAAPGAEMDLGWDDDESATQIMDKPAEVAAALQTKQRPAAGRKAPAPAAPAAPAPGVPRVTGSLPALPALPNRPPTTTALGIAPPPATSLPSVPAPQVAAAPAIAAPAPAVAAPMVTTAAPPMSYPPPGPAPYTVPNAQPNPFGGMAPGFTLPAKSDLAPAKTNGVSVKADWPANTPAPATPARKKDTKSTALLAFFGVIAVAALVVLALQLTGSPPVGTLVINTSEGADVLVDGQPVPGVGTRYEVSGLSAGRPHHITVRKAGFDSIEQDYPVIEGANTLPLPLSSSQTVAAAVPTPPPVDPVQQLAPPPAPIAAPTTQQLPAPAQPLAPPPSQPAVQPPTQPAAPPVARVERPRPPRIRPTTPVEPPPPRPAPAPTPAPAAAAAGGTGNGTLLMSTSPASQCTVPGQGTRSTPFRMSLAPGRYSVQCVNANLDSRANFNITIAAGQTADYRNRPLE